MAQPFIGELFHAVGGEAWYEGPGGTRRLSTRKTLSLADATLCHHDAVAVCRGGRAALRPARNRRPAAALRHRLLRLCYARGGPYRFVVEVGLQSYDIVALIPIIEAAGGMITGWDGGPAEAGGEIVAAATPELHEAAMGILRRRLTARPAQAGLVGARHEGIEGGEQLLAEDVGLLQNLVAGADDGEDRAAAQGAHNRRCRGWRRSRPRRRHEHHRDLDTGDEVRVLDGCDRLPDAAWIQRTVGPPSASSGCFS